MLKRFPFELRSLCGEYGTTENVSTVDFWFLLFIRQEERSRGPSLGEDNSKITMAVPCLNLSRVKWKVSISFCRPACWWALQSPGQKDLDA